MTDRPRGSGSRSPGSVFALGVPDRLALAGAVLAILSGLIVWALA